MKEPFPLVNWRETNIPLLNFTTTSLRSRCEKTKNFSGNYAPFIHPILHYTNPNIKGCRQFSNLIYKATFDKKNWVNFDNLTNTHNLDPDLPQTQISKLAKTSKLIEGKDLQYLVLRNTCLTNSKLHSMKILPSPDCTLCLHPSQNSTHRFFHCKFVQTVWEFLCEITKDTSIAHTFTFACAIVNVTNRHKNHPLILLTNFMRLLIDKARINNIKIHPNTFSTKF